MMSSNNDDAGGPAGRDAERATFAEWWRRLLALLIDGLILAAASAVFIFVASLRGTPEAISRVLLILYFLINPVYFVYFHGRAQGQSPGKMLLKIRVRDDTTDAAIGYGRALGRWLVTFVFGLFFFPLILDGLWPLWDARRQALHDKVANSIVVKAT